MGFPDLFKLEKLKIYAYADSQRAIGQETGTFEAMFNPESFSQTYSTRYVPSNGAQDGAQTATFARANPATLRLKILLDGSNVEEMGLISLFSETKTVKQRIDEFLALAYNVQSQTHEPNFLTVTWGDSLNFPCRLASVTITHTNFDNLGNVVRAELDLDLVADEELEKQLKKAALSSPDVSHTRLVAAGDTLPLLAKGVYGSSRFYVRVARANRLSHFRRLQPGQELLFPPLAK